MDSKDRSQVKPSPIDIKQSRDILARVNALAPPSLAKSQALSFPQTNDILDCRNLSKFVLELGRHELEVFLQKQNTRFNSWFAQNFPLKNNSNLALSGTELQMIGKELFPQYAFGILNGGSATSYLDVKKNRDFSPELYEIYRHDLEEFRREYLGKAKACTPAYMESTGLRGPSFLELKVRALLKTRSRIRLFQMTSTKTDPDIHLEFERIAQIPALQDAFKITELELKDTPTAIQALITAFTPSSFGHPREIYLDKNGKTLGLPAGHGQSFSVLKEVFQELYKEGCRYVSIGNVDNIAYNPDPLSLAITAMTDSTASFCFTYKTAVDTKGGVLVCASTGHFDCKDIGLAISKEEVSRAEEAGVHIMFNTAIGYFDLEKLLANIDRIIATLPIRLSEQNKENNSYSQAEQSLWEVIALLDNIQIIGLAKNRRLLAAKLLVENFINSSYKIAEFPRDLKELNELSRYLAAGLDLVKKEDFQLD